MGSNGGSIGWGRRSGSGGRRWSRRRRRGGMKNGGSVGSGIIQMHGKAETETQSEGGRGGKARVNVGTCDSGA